jgi:hypothetical protein
MRQFPTAQGIVLRGVSWYSRSSLAISNSRRRMFLVDRLQVRRRDDRSTYAHNGLRGLSQPCLGLRGLETTPGASIARAISGDAMR